MRYGWILASILLFLMPAAPMSAQVNTLSAEPAWVPEFIEQDCTESAPYNFDMTCGILRVPENRNNPNSAIIELAVVIVQTRSENPQPDPIVYLVGGPGGSIVRSATNFFSSNMIPFAHQRDIISLLRGTRVAHYYCAQSWRQSWTRDGDSSSSSS